MSSNLLKIAAEFTQDSVATIACACERPSCFNVIQPGENRFYVSNEGRPDIPGRYICASCMKHYLGKRTTTARVVQTAAQTGTQAVI